MVGGGGGGAGGAGPHPNLPPTKSGEGVHLFGNACRRESCPHPNLPPTKSGEGVPVDAAARRQRWVLLPPIEDGGRSAFVRQRLSQGILPPSQPSPDEVGGRSACGCSGATPTMGTPSPDRRWGKECICSATSVAGNLAPIPAFPRRSRGKECLRLAAARRQLRALLPPSQMGEGWDGGKRSANQSTTHPHHRKRKSSTAAI